MLNKIKFNIVPILLFIVIFGLYLYTSPPGTTNYADSSELITASYILGIPHPPGYPVFVLVGKLFSFIPIGEIAFRYSIMSSMFGAFTVTLVYLIIDKILSGGKSRTSQMTSRKAQKQIGVWRFKIKDLKIRLNVPALTGALSLAFSYIFWLYSIVPEVWAFNNLFTAFLLYLGIKWYYSKKVKSSKLKVQSTKNSKIENWSLKIENLRRSRDYYPVLIAFTSGIAFWSHQMIVLLAPALLYLIWIKDKKLFTSFKRLLKSLGGLAVGFILPMLYFPISGLRYTVIDFGNAKSLDDLRKLATRYYYAEFSSTGNAYLQTELNLSKRISEIPHYAAVLTEYFSLPMVFLGFFGVVTLLVLLARSNYKDIKHFLGIAFLFSGLLFAMYTTLGVERVDAGYNLLGVNERMYIMGSVIFAIFVGFGAKAFLKIVEKSKYLSVPIAVLALLFLPLYPLYTNFANANKSDFYLGEDYAYNFFRNVPQNAILFVRGDMPNFVAYYYTEVKKERADVTIVSLSLPPWQIKDFKKQNPGLWDRETKRLGLIIRDIIDDNIGKRALYFTGLQGGELLELGLRENPYVLSPRGLLTEVTLEFDPKSEEGYWSNMRWRNSDKSEDYHDWFSKEIIEQYLIGHFNSFSGYLRYGYYDEAKKELEEMQRIDPFYPGTSAALLRFGRDGGEGYEEKDPRLNKTDLEREALKFVEQGNIGGTQAHFKYLIQLEPENIFFRLQLAKLHTFRGWYDEAEKEANRILEMEPKNTGAPDILRIVEENRQKEIEQSNQLFLKLKPVLKKFRIISREEY